MKKQRKITAKINKFKFEITLGSEVDANDIKQAADDINRDLNKQLESGRTLEAALASVALINAANLYSLKRKISDAIDTELTTN